MENLKIFDLKQANSGKFRQNIFCSHKKLPDPAPMGGVCQAVNELDRCLRLYRNI